MIDTDVSLLLRACREAPADDAPRMILADAVQESGFEDAAIYIRESIAFHNTPSKKRKRRADRTMIGIGYQKWLAHLFGVPVGPLTGEEQFVIGGDSWDQFVWNEKYNSRRAVLDIERGLPDALYVTCPLLIERAADLFVFPIAHCKVTDRHPDREEVVPGDVTYHWVPATLPQKFNTWEDTQYQVPSELRKLMPLGKPHRLGRQSPVGQYETRTDAYHALKVAALAFGRASVS